MPNSADDPKQSEVTTLRLLGAGFEFVALCGGGALLGLWLDSRLGTAPWMLVGLAVAGFAVATLILLRGLVEADRPRDDEA